MNDELLIETVVSAFRETSPRGAVEASPAWHDLGTEQREQAATLSAMERRLESAMRADGLNSTVRAVLARITEPN